MEHVIGHAEGIGEGRVLVADTEQVLVRDHDQRVDEVLQLFDAFFGERGAMATFELERLGHNTDRQNALFACSACDNRCGTCARATAHTCGDKGHVAALEMIDDLVKGFFGRGASDIRTGTSAQTVGDVGTELDTTF